MFESVVKIFSEQSLISYLVFFLSYVFFYLANKIVVYLKKFFKKISRKTKLKFDDILIESIAPTLSLFLFAFVFLFSISYFVGSLKIFLDKFFIF